MSNITEPCVIPVTEFTGGSQVSLHHLLHLSLTSLLNPLWLSILPEHWTHWTRSWLHIMFTYVLYSYLDMIKWFLPSSSLVSSYFQNNGYSVFLYKQVWEKVSLSRTTKLHILPVLCPHYQAIEGRVFLTSSSVGLNRLGRWLKTTMNPNSTLLHSEGEIDVCWHTLDLFWMLRVSAYTGALGKPKLPGFMKFAVQAPRVSTDPNLLA